MQKDISFTSASKILAVKLFSPPPGIPSGMAQSRMGVMVKWLLGAQ